MKFLLCLDGSDHSEVCLRYCLWFAKRSQASVEVLFASHVSAFEMSVVADFGGALGAQPYHDLVGQMEQLQRDRAKLLMEVTAARFEEAGLADRFHFHHLQGSLIDCVREVEESTDIDIVFLGKRGENATADSAHLGSSLERMIRSSPLPCLVTNRSYREIDRIALAYDGGPSCRKAVEWLTLSPLFRGLDLHLLTVDDDYRPEECREQLETAKAVLESGGLKPEAKLLEGEVEEAIAAYLKEYSIDLLITGAYGHSRIRELLIGSTTNLLLRECHVPVFMFR